MELNLNGFNIFYVSFTETASLLLIHISMTERKGYEDKTL